ncbi:MAG: BMP family ABC transporter substrate-binding protein, partial [Candidatus Heimdallarchaeota archaeon]|nr:BMP family ABC transporter substrate-binding protein [Candidatus Heimdallarchaeota archaeon]MCK5049172.1 BMP family ABC transporter substrate-binding protein [Candidatus Heimdallarchaeota archaeon]
MKNKKIILSIAFTLLLMSSYGATAMASTVNEITPMASDAKIAVVFSTGGLGDKSFNDAAKVGVEQAKTEFPGITVDETEPATVDEINNAIEAYAVDGTYDLIIAIGFSSAGGVNASALAHTDQQYMIID